MRVLTPPSELDLFGLGRSVFLAGSIEMGTAENWQERVIERWKDEEVTILNPRRDDWDSSWEQRADNAPFREQVEWELDAQLLCTAILMHFVPGTQSPISLLELGLFAPTTDMFVCCPEGFWRKGNVDIVCERWDVPVYETLEEAADAAMRFLG